MAKNSELKNKVSRIVHQTARSMLGVSNSRPLLAGYVW